MVHDHHHGETDNLRLAFFLNLGFTIFEIIGGVWINSVAILSDALHDLGDSLSLGLAWFLQNYSSKGSGDKRFSYGYRRFSLLGALVNALVLAVGSAFILIETIPRLLDPESFKAPWMIAFALVGVAVNGAAAFRLRGQHSSNAEVMSLHLLEDVLGWVAVLLVGIVSLFVNLPILDPLLAIAIAAYVLVNVLKKLIDTARLFLQAVPGEVDLQEIEQRIAAINGVESTHHVHIWSLDGEHHVLSAHLIVDKSVSKQDMVRMKRDVVHAAESLELEHVTIEFEFGEGDCSIEETAEHEFT